LASINVTPIEGILHDLVGHRATDVIFSAGSPPVMRIDGEVERIGTSVLSAEDTEAIVRGVLPPELWDACVRDKEVDFAFDWSGVARIRGNAFHQRGSLALALRLIPFQIPSFEDLGVPATVQSWTTLHQGLVLVTGPTGSGKSTTLAAMIDAVNTHRACHVLTVEDPIEYVHHHKKSLVNQRELGTDCASFARALRSALREDPDVLLVGEMRDPETIQAVLTIAETGHLVLSTLHTNDAAQALDRVVDVFGGDQQNQIRVQLAGSLLGIVSQRLLPRANGGLVAAFEVLVATYAVKNLVRDGKTTQIRNQIATGAQYGMSTLESSLSELITAGVITYDEALIISLYPKELAQPTTTMPIPEVVASSS
jgi:twitching motility protein PilT